MAYGVWYGCRRICTPEAGATRGIRLRYLTLKTEQEASIIRVKELWSVCVLTSGESGWSQGLN